MLDAKIQIDRNTGYRPTPYIHTYDIQKWMRSKHSDIYTHTHRNTDALKASSDQAKLANFVEGADTESKINRTNSPPPEHLSGQLPWKLSN